MTNGEVFECSEAAYNYLNYIITYNTFSHDHLGELYVDKLSEVLTRHKYLLIKYDINISGQSTNLLKCLIRYLGDEHGFDVKWKDVDRINIDKYEALSLFACIIRDYKLSELV